METEIKKCSICGILTDDIFCNLKNEECCEDCYNLPINCSLSDINTLENILFEVYSSGYELNLLAEGEGRYVKDLEDILNLPIVMKTIKNNKINDVMYQNFVENYIYSNSDSQIKENFLGKIFLSGDNTNSYVFMEKCYVLDDDFFTGLDLRDIETYNELIIDNIKLNIPLLKKRTMEILIDKLNNEGYNLSNIDNNQTLINIFSYFLIAYFNDNIYEIENETNQKLTELKDNINDYILEITPNEFNYLYNTHGCSLYDVSEGKQWGVSYIDNKFKLIDYGTGLHSKDFFNQHK